MVQIGPAQITIKTTVWLSLTVFLSLKLMTRSIVSATYLSKLDLISIVAGAFYLFFSSPLRVNILRVRVLRAALPLLPCSSLPCSKQHLSTIGSGSRSLVSLACSPIHHLVGRTPRPQQSRLYQFGLSILLVFLSHLKRFHNFTLI